MRALVGLLVVAMLAAGCSGARGRETPANAPPPAAGAAAAAPAVVSTDPPLSLTVSYSAPSMSQVPALIAVEAGYFREQGLEVNLVSIRSSAQNAAALIAGEVDVSVIGGVGPIRARLSGSDIVLIGATKPYFSGAVVARPEIATPADLRGKRLGVSARGGNTDLMARSVLPRLGLQPDVDVTLFPTGESPQTVAALVAGNIDAGAMAPPMDEMARSLGFSTLFDVTAAKVPYLAVGLGTTATTLERKPAAIERFLRAYGQAVHRYRTDKAYTLAVAPGLVQNDDPAVNEQAYETERGHMQPDLDLPLAAIVGTLELVRLDDPRAADARPEDFIDLRLLRGLQQSGYFERLYGGRLER
jgi:ABC-type nitrate/sulfonate/bicarbonate transport system substrate-binding protein